jgi:hypothetical protein
MGKDLMASIVGRLLPSSMAALVLPGSPLSSATVVLLGSSPDSPSSPNSPLHVVPLAIRKLSSFMNHCMHTSLQWFDMLIYSSSSLTV